MKKYLIHFLTGAPFGEAQGGAIEIWVDTGSDPEKVFSGLFPKASFLYAEEVAQ